MIPRNPWSHLYWNTLQSDSALPPTQNALPAELQLTTQALLMTLPSSTHFMLLPQNLKSYKPYVDLDSSSSRVPPSHLIQKVDDWFKSRRKVYKVLLIAGFSMFPLSRMSGVYDLQFANGYIRPLV